MFAFRFYDFMNPRITPHFASDWIIDESADYLVVNKPPHLLAHPKKPDGTRTLWHALRELLAFELANGGQISIINRLDRETSGLTLIAKHAVAARKFSMLMEQRRIHKEYLALVLGWPREDEYEIDAPIGREGDFQPSRIYVKQMAHPQHSQGATAQTRICVESRFEKKIANREDGGAEKTLRFSLVRAFPATGRTHQIRVHLAHIGHPLIGDKIYGADETCYLEFIETGWTSALANRLFLPRHALHSARISIDTLEAQHDWRSPLANDLADWIGADAKVWKSADCTD